MGMNKRWGAKEWEMEVWIPLEFIVNHSIPVGGSGCGTGSGQGLPHPWDLEEAKSLGPLSC